MAVLGWAAAAPSISLLCAAPGCKTIPQSWDSCDNRMGDDAAQVSIAEEPEVLQNGHNKNPESRSPWKCFEHP